MKRFILIYLALVFVLAACGGSPSTTAAPANGSGSTAEANGNAPASNDSSAGGNSNSGASNSNAASNSNSASSSGGGGDSNTNSASGSNDSTTTGTGGDCSADIASFVADVTVADNTTFQPGQHFEKTWLVKNNGNCVWTDQYTLLFSNGDEMGGTDPTSLQETAPGSTTEITVNLTAPNEEGVTRARADFQIRNADGSAIPVDDGTTLWVIIRVNNGEAAKGGGTSSAGPGYATVTCGYTTDAARVSQVFAALNAYRAQSGIGPYILNDQLSEAAQAHAADMACNQLFYHNGSNSSTAKSRVAASGYLASYVTENVYGSWPPLSPADAIQWWANDVADPRHNENLLSTKYIEAGVGYAFFNNYGYYVIDFGVPQ